MKDYKVHKEEVIHFAKDNKEIFITEIRLAWREGKVIHSGKHVCVKAWRY